jgi:hypothetical protein
MKIAKDADQAWQIEDKKENQPHAWIQWKGTDVCMDVYCECGSHSHIDGDFAYFIKCNNCGAIYSCNGHIEIIKLLKKPEGRILEEE